MRYGDAITWTNSTSSKKWLLYFRDKFGNSVRHIYIRLSNVTSICLQVVMLIYHFLKKKVKYTIKYDSRILANVLLPQIIDMLLLNTMPQTVLPQLDQTFDC